MPLVFLHGQLLKRSQGLPGALKMSEELKILQTDQLDLSFGHHLTLIVDPGASTKEFDFTLIGCIAGRSLILGPPETGVMPLLAEGQTVFVRINLHSGVAFFPSVVLFVSDIPTVLVYLDYPDHVRFKQIRAAMRVQVRLPIIANNLSDTRFSALPGKISDISTTGASLEFYEALGQTGQNILIKGKFEVGPVQRLLSIPAQIRSTKQQNDVYIYGIEFAAANEDNLLVLFGFIFHAMAFKPIKPIS